MTDTINQVGAGAPADRLREALVNMLAAFDNPIARRKLGSDFSRQAIESARAALDDQPECGCCGQTGECDADCDSRQAQGGEA